MKKTLVKGLALAFVGSLFATSAMAITYHVDDNMINFPGWEHLSSSDEIGSPQIDWMEISVNDCTGYLETVELSMTNRVVFDVLFISEDGGFHAWDWYVYDNGGTNRIGEPGYQAQEGLFSVASPYDYTYADGGRPDHPNGIETDDLTLFDGAFTPTYSSDLLTYDFAGAGLQIELGDNFAIAYAPFCANDVIGYNNPIPEPATMLLFGTGLAGLAGLRRRKNR